MPKLRTFRVDNLSVLQDIKKELKPGERVVSVYPVHNGSPVWGPALEVLVESELQSETRAKEALYNKRIPLKKAKAAK
jgi:hypothetical protein